MNKESHNINALIKYLNEKKISFAVNEITGKIVGIQILKTGKFWRANGKIISWQFAEILIKHTQMSSYKSYINNAIDIVKNDSDYLKETVIRKVAACLENFGAYCTQNGYAMGAKSINSFFQKQSEVSMQDGQLCIVSCVDGGYNLCYYSDGDLIDYYGVMENIKVDLIHPLPIMNNY